MRRFIIFLAALLIGVIPSAGVTVFVQAEDELWPAWHRLTAAYPLPSSVREERAAPGEQLCGDRLILKIGEVAGFKVVERIVLAPVARIGDPEDDVTLDAVRAGAVRTAPLESVTFPDVALPVDGLFPDQPGYPLHGDVALGLQSSDRELRAWFDSLPPASPGTGTDILWVGAVGDVMPARGVDEALLSTNGVQHVFGDTLPALQSCALLLGNLEAAATTAGSRARKTYTFRFAPEALGALKEAGFSYLSLANNHTFDFGTRGFLDTLANLSRWGLVTSGAGGNAEEASQPFVAHFGSTEVRILSFAAYPVDRTGFDGRQIARATADRPGTLWLDDAGLATAARGFSPRSFNIALVHGGQEWSVLPTAYQRRLYTELVRAGADLVIGSHPHVLQGMQVFQGSLIAYSLGNFLFPGMEGTDGGEDSVILKLGLYQGKIRFVRARPVRIQGASVRLAEGDTTRLRLLRLTRELAAHAGQ
jgi:poly-gamma-glutamate synthesis protein (capsule biosynthesis protein)